MGELVRVQFEIDEERIKEFDELRERAGVRTKKELFNNALTILKWAIKEKKRGRIIASVDEKNNKYQELGMPVLDAFRSTGDH